MATAVSICNQALSWLGANLIISLDDDTTEGKLCKANYAEIRDAVQEAYNWSFCTRWIKLNALADPPEGEYANAYLIPSDALRVIFVGQNYEQPVQFWQVETYDGGNLIRTDGIAVRAQVIWREPDTSKFSPLFVQALAARMAADLAIPITNSRTMMEMHTQMYAAKMRQAASMDSHQGKSRRIRSRWLNSSRSAGPSGGAGPYV